MKILLLSHHDISSEAIGAERVQSFAKHLTALGSEVRQIRGLHEPTSAPRSSTPKLRSSASRSLRRIAGWLTDNFIAIPDRQVLTAFRLWRKVRGARDWRPDVIVASGPPFSIFLTAALLSRDWKVPWVADYRDLWSTSGYYLHGSARRRLDRRIEARVLRTCSRAVAVSQPLVDELCKEFSVQAAVVMNGYEPSAQVENISANPGDEYLKLVYTGSIYPGKRDPSALLTALALAGSKGYHIYLNVYGPTNDYLTEAIDSCGVEGKVALWPSIPRVDVASLQRSADILVLLMWNDPRERGVYSGKLFEYLNARRPILMVGYEQGVAADLIQERRAGIVSNDSHEIASALIRWADEKRSTGRVAELPVDVGKGLSRRDAAQRLHSIIGSIVAGSTGPR